MIRNNFLEQNVLIYKTLTYKYGTLKMSVAVIPNHNNISSPSVRSSVSPYLHGGGK